MNIDKYNEIKNQTIVQIFKDKITITSTYIFIDNFEKKEFIDMYLLIENTK